MGNLFLDDESKVDDEFDSADEDFDTEFREVEFYQEMSKRKTSMIIADSSTAYSFPFDFMCMYHGYMYL